MRQLTKNIAHVLIRASGVPRVRRRRNRAGTIFALHNVVPDEHAGAVGDPALHLGRSAFAHVVEWIAAAYEVVPLSEIVDRLQTGKPVNQLASITFDDAYRGVFKHAAPILRSHKLPATVFVVTNASSDPQFFWWDEMFNYAGFGRAEREYCLAELRGDAELIRERFRKQGAPDMALPDDLLPGDWPTVLSAYGDPFEYGAHTTSHRNLAALEGDQLRVELGSCREVMAEHLGSPPSLLAYPYGCQSESVREAARRVGYEAAVLNTRGFVGPEAPRMALPRISMSAGTTRAALACRVADLDLAFLRRTVSR